VGIVINIITLRRTEEMKASITGIRAWKESSLLHVFGPLRLEFERTKAAFRRLKPHDNWIEANVMKASNTRIRDMLLENGHLIPPDLVDDAAALIEHYDVYLQEYDRVRESEDASRIEAYIFAGPKGFPFPKHAQGRMIEHYEELLTELYDVRRKSNS
jgi:hypothetical protein